MIIIYVYVILYFSNIYYFSLDVLKKYFYCNIINIQNILFCYKIFIHNNKY